MTLTVSNMAVIRDIAKSINALVDERAVLVYAKSITRTQCVRFGSQIDAQYKHLFALLPLGAENDQALLDQILAADDVFWTEINRDEITGDDVDQWCDDYLHGEGTQKGIAHWRLLFFFGGPSAFNLYLAKYVALMAMKNTKQSVNKAFLKVIPQTQQ